MTDLAGIDIDRSLRIRAGQFIDQTQAKSLIVVHHTADGSPSASLAWWNQDPQRIATAYVIDRDGIVHETFDPSAWAYHTGTGSKLDRRSIGIELTNWGWLTERNGRYFNWKGGEVDADDVVEAPWRGHRYWQRYPQAQLDALYQLVPALCDHHGIDRDCAPEDRERTDLQRWKGFLGVISHYHIRADKTDVSPAFPWADLTAAVEGTPELARQRVVMEPLTPRGPVPLAERDPAADVRDVELPPRRAVVTFGAKAQIESIRILDVPPQRPAAELATTDDEDRFETVIAAIKAGRWVLAAWRALRLALALR